MIADELRLRGGFIKESASIDYRVSWPRPATQCDLVPLWAGEFATFDDWVNKATTRLTGTTDKLMGGQLQSICIDAVGRRCTMGGHFVRARDEGTFPVRYFWECISSSELDRAIAAQDGV